MNDHFMTQATNLLCASMVSAGCYRLFCAGGSGYGDVKENMQELDISIHAHHAPGPAPFGPDPVAVNTTASTPPRKMLPTLPSNHPAEQAAAASPPISGDTVQPAALSPQTNATTDEPAASSPQTNATTDEPAITASLGTGTATDEPATSIPVAADGTRENVNNNAINALDDGIALPWLNVFLGTKYASFILNPVSEVCVCVTYLIVLAVAIHGMVVQLEVGFERASFVVDDSYYRTFINRHVEDFSAVNGYFVHVVIDETLDYTDPFVRAQINELKASFTQSEHFVERAWISWLDTFLGFVDLETAGIQAMPQFIGSLQQVFQNPRLAQFRADVQFNTDNTQITNSRFFIQATNLTYLKDDEAVMLESRRLARESDLNVVVFAVAFPFLDQTTEAASNTIQNLGIATASIALVSLLLIPSLTTITWVILATISISVCIIGYMSYWGVFLDTISMINLVMCFGFSVDFAAHISYHYMTCPDLTPRERMRDCLGNLGAPILQGGVSTVLGVSALAGSDSYLFRTFFKLVFLVILFGIFHALFVLPVLIPTFDYERFKKSAKPSPQPSHALPSARLSA